MTENLAGEGFVLREAQPGPSSGARTRSVHSADSWSVDRVAIARTNSNVKRDSVWSFAFASPTAQRLTAMILLGQG
ncbi:MAG: hypothetical protein EOP04_05130 [Proteobacteria bacterium]|nr:MAG: hypothetical protein EOP04_05130 [Pseudomonadota bacterium]